MERQKSGKGWKENDMSKMSNVGKDRDRAYMLRVVRELGRGQIGHADMTYYGFGSQCSSLYMLHHKEQKGQGILSGLQRIQRDDQLPYGPTHTQQTQTQYKTYIIFIILRISCKETEYK